MKKYETNATAEIKTDVMISIYKQIKMLVDEELKMNKDIKNIVTNAQTATVFEDIPVFVRDETSNIDSEILSRHGIYKLGKYRDTTIYVDPDMKFTDNKMIFISDDLNCEPLRIVELVANGPLI
jgi:hypothetical protein